MNSATPKPLVYTWIIGFRRVRSRIKHNNKDDIFWDINQNKQWSWNAKRIFLFSTWFCSICLWLVERQNGFTVRSLHEDEETNIRNLCETDEPRFLIFIALWKVINHLLRIETAGHGQTTKSYTDTEPVIIYFYVKIETIAIIYSMTRKHRKIKIDFRLYATGESSARETRRKNINFYVDAYNTGWLVWLGWWKNQ